MAGPARGVVRLALCCGVLLLLSLPAAVECAKKEKKEGPQKQGKVTYLWPIHFSSIPLAGKAPRSTDSAPLESPDFARTLADIGLRGFREYLKNTLPQELKLDPTLAEMWGRSDHSRVNYAFYRWQKRVFAEASGMAVESLTAKFEPAPRVEGIDYAWPELYESKEFQRLQGRVSELAKLYLKRSGMAADQVPSKFRIFSWVEVYDKGDALRPDSRIQGAYLAGRFFASVESGAIKFNFEDPRGINPPFGKTFSHMPYAGNLVMHPVWNSYFVTPNMKDTPVVSFCFLVFPANGTTASWTDDPSSRIKIERPFKVQVL